MHDNHRFPRRPPLRRCRRRAHRRRRRRPATGPRVGAVPRRAPRRGRRAVMSNRIVVGVDGSEQSREALRWATRMAQVLSAELEAVFAWADPLTEAYVAGWGYHSADVDPVAAA